jgi:hypothetical protein
VKRVARRTSEIQIAQMNEQAKLLADNEYHVSAVQRIDEE